MKRILVGLLLALLVLSCASAGRQIEMNTIQEKIKLKESTRDDVFKYFGEPLSKNNDVKNESEIWHYAYVSKHITGGGIITHVLGIGSEWQSNTEVIDFYFQNGVVVDIKNESSNVRKFHLQ